MTIPALARCVVATLVAFAVVAILAGLLSKSAGGDAAYVLTGAGALLAPLAGAVAGTWQAQAAGTRRPFAGIAVAAVVAGLIGLGIYSAGDTNSDAFNALKPVLVIAGALIGALLRGYRWYGSTARL